MYALKMWNIKVFLFALGSNLVDLIRVAMVVLVNLPVFGIGVNRHRWDD
jgi:hypothetical protein